MTGEGRARDAEEGERWLRAAAEAKDAKAMACLGVHLLGGVGVGGSGEDGERWLRAAADAQA